MAREIRFGVFVPQGWRMDLTEIDDPVEQFEAMIRVAKAADAGPWDSVWVYDHFHTTPEPTLEATFECWSTSAALARDTHRVHIGQMVGCNGYRNPALYAKIASTVDVASHGRLYAGLGAGWYEHEWRAYGYGFPPLRDRMEAFREGVEIIHKMWTEERPAYHGAYFSIDQPINEPKGARGRPPKLWLGGGGPRVTLRLVAQYADGSNFGGGNPEVFRDKIAILRQHCADVGRDPAEITKSTSLNVHLLAPGEDPERATSAARGTTPLDQYRQSFLVGTADQVQARLSALIDAGAEYVIVYLPRLAYDQTMLERFASSIIASR